MFMAIPYSSNAKPIWLVSRSMVLSQFRHFSSQWCLLISELRKVGENTEAPFSVTVLKTKLPSVSDSAPRTELETYYVPNKHLQSE